MKPIHHTFGPLSTSEQISTALLLQVQPHKWMKGEALDALRDALSSHFSMHCNLFLRGRDALLAGLQALELQKDDEVIVQGYTCAVLPNAISRAGGVPVYCDIEKHTLNLDIQKVEAACTKRTRAIICQHTFGIPAYTQALRKLCDEKKIALIEDCAHTLPLSASQSNERSIGRLGDMVICSFGRDKALSGVSGGAVLTPHTYLAKQLRQTENNAPLPSLYETYNLLCYPLRYTYAKTIWRFGAGKAYLRWLSALGWLPRVLEPEEKHGNAPPVKQLPNGLALLALEQWRQLQSFNEHRRTLRDAALTAAQEYAWHSAEDIELSLAPQKYPLFTQNANVLRARLKTEHIYLDDGWCNAVVCPASTHQDATGYTPGSCPIAEDVAMTIVSLPLHPTMNMRQLHSLFDTLHATALLP